VEHPQERPQVFGDDGRSFQSADDAAELVTLVDGLLRDETVERQPPLEFFAVGRAPRAVEQPDEILEKRIRASQRDEHEAVVLGIERVGLLEIPPEVANGLLAFVVVGTDGEAAFHLPDEPRSRPACARADDENVVRIEAEMFGLEMDFGDAGIGQDRRDAADEQLR